MSSSKNGSLDEAVLLARVTAELQRFMLDELTTDPGNPRNRELVAGAARLIGRLNIHLDAANRLAEPRLSRWRRLAHGMGATPTASDDRGPRPAAEIAELSAAMSRAVDDPALLHGMTTGLPESVRLFESALAAARDYVDAREAAALPKPTGSGSKQDGSSQRAKLAAYLHARFPGLPADPIRSFAIIPGGGSKETALFRLVDNDVLPTNLVLRRDKANTPTGTSVFGEFALLKTLEGARLPVPAPVLAEKDPAHLGGGFILVAEICGAKRVGHLFPELNEMSALDPSFGPDLAEALARLHTLPETALEGTMGGHHSSTGPIEMVLNFQTLWRGLQHKPPMSLATPLGFAWLLSHPLPTHRPRRVVHGDVGMHNMMMRDGRLAAILDWELAHIGDPAEDIGYIRALILPHVMTWDGFVERYVAAGGDSAACDEDAVNWYGVWAHTRNSVYTALLYDLATRGERSDLELYASALDYFPRTQQYIVRELAAATRQTAEPSDDTTRPH